MKRIAIFVVIALATPHFGKARNSSDEYPDIQELFPALSPEGRRSPTGSLDGGIDIERIDINKYKKKLEVFVNTLHPNVTVEDTRRQKVPYYSYAQFKRGSRHILKAKALDLMLQTIYMARHSVRQLEKEKYFSKTDTGYRIAFLYRRLRRMWRRMMDIYSMMRNNYRQVRKYKPAYIMVLHLKAIKLHTDFLYFWWVLITIDGKYTMKLRPTTTRGRTTTMASNLTEDITEEGAADGDMVHSTDLPTVVEAK